MTVVFLSSMSQSDKKRDISTRFFDIYEFITIQLASLSLNTANAKTHYELSAYRKDSTNGL